MANESLSLSLMHGFGQKIVATLLQAWKESCFELAGVSYSRKSVAQTENTYGRRGDDHPFVCVLSPCLVCIVFRKLCMITYMVIQHRPVCLFLSGRFECEKSEYDPRACSCISLAPPKQSAEFARRKMLTSFVFHSGDISFEVSRRKKAVLVSTGITDTVL